MPTTAANPIAITADSGEVITGQPAILAAAKKQKLEEQTANQCGGATADAEEIKPEVEVRTPSRVSPLATAQTPFTVSSSLGFTSQQAITATAGKATVKVADSHGQVRPPRLSEMRQQAAVINDGSDGSSLKCQAAPVSCRVKSAPCPCSAGRAVSDCGVSVSMLLNCCFTRLSSSGSVKTVGIGSN